MRNCQGDSDVYPICLTLFSFWYLLSMMSSTTPFSTLLYPSLFFSLSLTLFLSFSLFFSLFPSLSLCISLYLSVFLLRSRSRRSDKASRDITTPLHDVIYGLVITARDVVGLTHTPEAATIVARAKVLHQHRVQAQMQAMQQQREMQLIQMGYTYQSMHQLPPIQVPNIPPPPPPPTRAVLPRAFVFTSRYPFFPLFYGALQVLISHLAEAELLRASITASQAYAQQTGLMPSPLRQPSYPGGHLLTSVGTPTAAAGGGIGNVRGTTPVAAHARPLSPHEAPACVALLKVLLGAAVPQVGEQLSLPLPPPPPPLSIGGSSSSSMAVSRPCSQWYRALLPSFGGFSSALVIPPDDSSASLVFRRTPISPYQLYITTDPSSSSSSTAVPTPTAAAAAHGNNPSSSAVLSASAASNTSTALILHPRIVSKCSRDLLTSALLSVRPTLATMGFAPTDIEAIEVSSDFSFLSAWSLPLILGCPGAPDLPGASVDTPIAGAAYAASANSANIPTPANGGLGAVTGIAAASTATALGADAKHLIPAHAPGSGGASIIPVGTSVHPASGLHPHGFMPLTAPTLVDLLEFLLLEFKIIIIDTSLAVLTAASSALLSLLRPFDWACAYVPLLPQSLSDFLDSPVPILCGLTSLPDTISRPEDLPHDAIVWFPSQNHTIWVHPTYAASLAAGSSFAQGTSISSSTSTGSLIGSSNVNHDQVPILPFRRKLIAELYGPVVELARAVKTASAQAQGLDTSRVTFTSMGPNLVFGNAATRDALPATMEKKSWLSNLASRLTSSSNQTQAQSVLQQTFNNCPMLPQYVASPPVLAAVQKVQGVLRGYLVCLALHSTKAFVESAHAIHAQAGQLLATSTTPTHAGGGKKRDSKGFILSDDDIDNLQAQLEAIDKGRLAHAETVLPSLLALVHGKPVYEPANPLLYGGASESMMHSSTSTTTSALGLPATPMNSSSSSSNEHPKLGAYAAAASAHRSELQKMWPFDIAAHSFTHGEQAFFERFIRDAHMLGAFLQSVAQNIKRRENMEDGVIAQLEAAETARRLAIAEAKRRAEEELRRQVEAEAAMTSAVMRNAQDELERRNALFLQQQQQQYAMQRQWQSSTPTRTNNPAAAAAAMNPMMSTAAAGGGVGSGVGVGMSPAHAHLPPMLRVNSLNSFGGGSIPSYSPHAPSPSYVDNVGMRAPSSVPGMSPMSMGVGIGAVGVGGGYNNNSQVQRSLGYPQQYASPSSMGSMGGVPMSTPGGLQIPPSAFANHVPGVATYGAPQHGYIPR